MGGEFEALTQETTDLSARAGQATAALSAFLTEHQIGDFESELAALAARAGDIETQLLDAQTRVREADARSSALRQRFNSEPEQIELYQESDARRDLVEAQMQRERLLAAQPDSMPVRAADHAIAIIPCWWRPAKHHAARADRFVRSRAAHQWKQKDAPSVVVKTARRSNALRCVRGCVQCVGTRFRQLSRDRAIVETMRRILTRAEERGRSQMGRATDNINPVETASAPAQGKLALADQFSRVAAIVAVAVGLSRGLVAVPDAVRGNACAANADARGDARMQAPATESRSRKKGANLN